MLVCDITINVAEQRYVFAWGRDGVMFMCTHVYDVTLCGNTIRNVAVGLRLVGHPWHKGLKRYILSCLEIDNLKTAWINPVSTEWIRLVWSMKFMYWLLHQRSLRTANQIDNQTILSRATTRSGMKVYVFKKWTYRKH